MNAKKRKTFPRGLLWNSDKFFLLLIGIFTQFAQIFLTKALHYGYASVIMPFQYLGIIYALLVGLFVFDERLNVFVYAGVLLILFGVLMNTIYRHFKQP